MTHRKVIQDGAPRGARAPFKENGADKTQTCAGQFSGIGADQLFTLLLDELGAIQLDGLTVD